MTGLRWPKRGAWRGASGLEGSVRGAGGGRDGCQPWGQGARGARVADRIVGGCGDVVGERRRAEAGVADQGGGQGSGGTRRTQRLSNSRRVATWAREPATINRHVLLMGV